MTIRRVLLILLLFFICGLDGYQHFREQQAILKLEWTSGMLQLQRDILQTHLKHCK